MDFSLWFFALLRSFMTRRRRLKSMLLNVIRLQLVPLSFRPPIIAGFAARFQLEPHVRDRHRFVQSLAHVIDG